MLNNLATQGCLHFEDGLVSSATCSICHPRPKAGRVPKPESIVRQDLTFPVVQARIVRRDGRWVAHEVIAAELIAHPEVGPALAHAGQHRQIPKTVEQEAANAIAWYAQRATEHKLTEWHTGIAMERDPATGTYRYRLEVVG